MNLDKIMKMEHCPFDIDSICDPLYPTSMRMDQWMYVYHFLVKVYFSEFRKKYLGDKEDKFSNFRYLSQQEYDEEISPDSWMEELYEYRGYALELFLDFCRHCDFIVEIIYMDDVELGEVDAGEMISHTLDMLEHQKERDIYHKIFDKHFYIIENAYHLDAGCLCVVMSTELGWYVETQKKYPSFFNAKLRKENRRISRALTEMKYPLLFGYHYGHGCIEGVYYVIVDFGISNEADIDFEMLNPNWLINSFIAAKMVGGLKQKVMELEI